MKQFVILLSLILMVSCSDPEINIHAPLEGQTYVTEAYIYISATVNDEDGIKRVTYKIYGNTYDLFPAGSPVTYDLLATQSMYNFASGYEVEIIIEAEDDLGNIMNKKVTVKHS